ncbi:C6 transcription factor [Anopheles sinensis]|uniref:C6 transcription factor n=1 Tax=Anopheles sinensis TaxID=74873 RepID=A0A084W965_ANOSI|nr:C6 transcription factor [Anopheles sinensis]
MIFTAQQQALTRLIDAITISGDRYERSSRIYDKLRELDHPKKDGGYAVPQGFFPLHSASLQRSDGLKTLQRHSAPHKERSVLLAMAFLHNEMTVAGKQLPLCSLNIIV